jgi:aspartate racemase
MSQAYQVGESIGIVGGLGPLASAEFLKTIYECNLEDCEQFSPKVYMFSDPTFPDRTEAFLAGQTDELLQRLTDALQQLSVLGASKIVICCITIHYLLPRVPEHLRTRIISLLDVIFDRLEKSEKRHLLVCSSGTRKLGLFQNHSRWHDAQRFVVLPNEDDQNVIHRELIYPMKTTVNAVKQVPLLKSLLKKYEVDSFIVGCSEIHMLAKLPAFADSQNEFDCIDPLAIIAREIYKESI